MASQLLLATAAGLPHWLRLGAAASASGSVVEEVGYALGALPDPGPRGQELVLVAGDWLLTVADLRALEPLLLQNGLRLIRVESPMPEGLVAAASLGLVTPAGCAWVRGSSRGPPPGTSQPGRGPDPNPDHSPGHPALR
jgi:hypothetical protein